MIGSGENNGALPDIPFAERVKYACRLAGSAAKLAEKMGVSSRTLDKYKYSHSEPTRPFLVAMAEAVDLPLEWLATGQDTRSAETAQVLPVQGFGECGLKGWYNAFSLDQTLNLSVADKDAFAVMVVGRSMQPMNIRPGAVCVVSPHTPAGAGDIVYIEKTDGTVSIKKLIGMDGKWAELEGWLDPDEQGRQESYRDKISLKTVRHIYPVIWVKVKMT